MADLKKVYAAPDEQATLANLATYFKYPEAVPQKAEDGLMWSAPAAHCMPRHAF